MATFRRERAANLIRQEISQLISQGEVKDPRVDSMAAVTRVEVSKDLDFARVYVSGYLDEAGLERCVEGLNSAGGFIQSKLAKRFSFRNTPKLRFIEDHTIEAGFEMTQRLRQLESQPDQLRSADSISGRDAPETGASADDTTETGDMEPDGSAGTHSD